ncbi:YhdP family protein [Ancylobacter radicis]|uniref:YhdP central domain-containing protein n=1 Tax=Ancylobacter radicis TaxID=2836179 RepID=A0ABS5R898_9HYPH|nr:DUF3971 domain-containing protein [Ancylobacter radicis]MBS9477891.1 hypothetical protein [Ancylobacter radicis]
MNETTTRKGGEGRAGPGKRPRLRRLPKVCEVPPSRRRRRWLTVCGWSVGSVFGGTLLMAGLVYAFFLFGVLTIDMARPYVERALEARLAPGQTVQIGAITGDRAADGGMLLRASDIVVRDAAGEIIATAPQAEVEMQDTLLPWLMRPQRVDLVGVTVTVRIDPQGTVAISTEGAKPLQAPLAPVAVKDPSAAPASNEASSAPAEATADGTPLLPLRIPALAAIAKGFDQGGLDGGALSQLGLKDGTLIVRSEASGRQWTFNDIDLSVSSPETGGMAFDLKSGGTDGPWSARAAIGPLADGRRTVSVGVRDLAPRDLLIAAGKAGDDIHATSPLSVDFSADIDPTGLVLASTGRLVAGAGEFQMGADVAGRMMLDEVTIAFRFDPAAKVVMIDTLAAHAGPFMMDIAARLSVPDTAEGRWTLEATRSTASFGGGGRYADKDPPFVLDNNQLALSYDPAAKRIAIDKGVLRGAQGGIDLSGGLELSGEEPALGLNMSATPMSATSLKRMWPLVAAPEVRQWVYDNMISGEVQSAKISFLAPLSSIGNKQKPLPNDAVDILISGTNGIFQPVPNMPAVRGADILVHGKGRSAQVTATKGYMESPAGRRLNLPQGVFDVPNTIMDKPAAKVQFSLEGSAAAAVELIGLSPLPVPPEERLDPTAVKGDIAGSAQVNIRLSENIQPADVDYAFDASLTGFGLDNILMGQKLEDASVKVFVTPAAAVLRGDGKIGGAPASFEYTRPTQGNATFTLAANLDDAARTRLALDLGGLSGNVGVKLTGSIGPKTKSIEVDLDLTGARLAELVPGWSKPIGKAARLTADATLTAKGTRLDNLVVTGQGVNIRGTVELDSKAAFISANLPTFQLSDGDNASVKAETADGAMKITVRGEVIEARAFLKSLLEAPVAGRQNEKPADVDLDVNLGVVVGNNGETMRQAVLKLSRRNGDLRAFSLGALVGRDGGVKGELVARDRGRPLLRVTTTDAGALLRFINLYPRIYGGDLWIEVDAPRGDGAAQAGVVNMRDFIIRGETGLDRLIAAAPAAQRDGKLSPGSAIVFRKLQVDFVRTAEVLDIKDGAIWGPSIGSTFDGNLDFAADRISVRGTYVPAYGLNNLFSRVPVLGFFLGGGPNEGLVGVTYEIVGPLSGPTLRINPISAVAPGFLRKIFEFRQAPDPTPPATIPTR